MFGTPVAPHAIMEAVTVTCDKCGRSAFVHDAYYEYKATDGTPLPAVDHVLLAIVRTIDCPACSLRMQYETCNGKPA
jgi:hypothetical protein